MWEGKRLLEVIDAKGMSQADLARLLGVDKTTVWRWANNQRVPEDALKKKIAMALDTTFQVILEEDAPNQRWKLIDIKTTPKK